MARFETPPFERGTTLDGTDVTIADGDLDGTPGTFYHIEGNDYYFPDLSVNANTYRSGFYVKCRVVRNVAGIALLPGRLAAFKTTAGKYGAEIDGYVTTTAGGPTYPIDEYLPSAGVPDNHLCYVVIEGPALVSQSVSGGAQASISVGDRIVGATAATSQSTTAGRAEAQTIGGATAPLANQVQNRIGYAMSAKTTSELGDFLCNIGKW